MRDKLVFIYNAKTGFFNQTSDWLHKVISPESYDCKLCSLTYSNFGIRADWEKFVNELDYELEFFHKNEFIKKYGSSSDFPFIGITNGNSFEIIINSAHINKLSSLEELKNLLHSKLNLLENKR